MTTLRVLLHVAAQRDYEIHSLDFSTAFLQGSLHEEIWLRRPPGFTGSFPPGTQWSLRRPVYGLRQAPREWHDTLRTMLAALGFAPSTADPSLFLRTDALLPPFYILVYVDDLVFATAYTAGLAHVKLEHRTKHIALRYFLACELQQRGQLRLAYVASQANTADIFTKALQPCDHQRFCTMLGDGEASCSMVGVAEPTVSLALEAGEDFQAVVAVVQANPMAVLLDSGCSHHLMGTKAVFVDMVPSDGVKYVRGFNGALQPVEGRGTVTLQGEAGKRVLISDVLYVPGVQANLLSAGQLKESGVQLQGDGNEMLLVAATGEVLGRARYNGRVLCTDLHPCSTWSHSTEVVALRTIVSETKSTPDRLHARLAHVNVDTIKSSAKHKVATGLDITSSTRADPPCASCVEGKLARHTFPNKGSDAEEALAVVHIDLCGPFWVAAKDGSLFFLLLKDRHTRFVWVMPVAKKSDVLREFQKWLVLVERQAKKSVLMLRSDRGGEFLGKEFTDFVDGKGIVHDLTCPYTPQQNGMAERGIRTWHRRRSTRHQAHRPSAKLVDQDGKPSRTGEQQTGELVEQEAATRELPKPIGSEQLVEGSKQLVDYLTVDEEGELSAGEESTDSDVVEVPITKPGLRRTGRAQRPPERLSFDACLPPAAFTAVYDEVGDDLWYDDAEEDDKLPELDPDMHADPEHRWDIATMTKKSLFDEALYFKASDNGVTCWVLVYVYNLLAASSSPVILKELKQLLEDAFEQREISPAVKYLGLEIVRDKPARKLWLHQQGYVDKLCKRCIDEEHSGRVPKTPVSVDAYGELTFDDEEAQEHEEEEYRQKVGSLQFAATTTRPDIAVRHGKFVLKYIPTTEQPGDFLTKALHFPAFNRCSVAIGQVCLADVGDGDDDVQ
ncbi:unnamed protein product [Closterium sp. NIES-54]